MILQDGGVELLFVGDIDIAFNAEVRVGNVGSL